MKIIVMSDNHRSLTEARKILSKHKDADIVVHCGDSENTIDQLMLEFPDFEYIAVRGNCDFSFDMPISELFSAEGVTFFVTHGHAYSVKFGTGDLRRAAEEQGAKAALFGHTHIALNTYEDGVYLINPGSARGRGATYALIEVKDGELLSNILRIK